MARTREQQRDEFLHRSSYGAFLRDEAWAPHRAAIEHLYRVHGYQPAAGKTAAQDFMDIVQRSFREDGMSTDERVAMLGHFLAPVSGIDVQAFHRSLEGMHFADQLTARGIERDDADNFRGDGLPDRPEFARERENGGQSLRNQIEYSMQRAGLDPDRQQRRSIDSSRHAAVRFAVDRRTGSRDISAHLDNVDLLPHAQREAAEHEAREAERATREPSVREALSAAFPNDDEG